MAFTPFGTDCALINCQLHFGVAMKRFIIVLSIIVLFLTAGCVQAPPPEATQTSAPPVLAPTNTPMYLSPLYKTYIFVGGGGWATNLDQTNIYYTMDFGEHWLNVTPQGLDSPENAGSIFLAFLNGSLGWVCQSKIEASAVLYATKDGGKSWASHLLDFPCGNMAFVSPQEGMIVADMGVGAGSQYVCIHSTADAGATWTEVFKHDPASTDDHGLPSSGIKSSFALLDANTALIGGSRPMPGSLYLFRTIDRAVTWNPVSCDGLPDAENTELDPMDILPISATEVIVPIRVYLENGQMGTHFCVSTDAGASFNYRSTLENIEFTEFGSINNGLAYGQGRMMQTSDGGLTWEEVTSRLPIGLTPVSLSMMNENIGFLTTTLSVDSLLQNRIFMTANNGDSWQSMPGIIIGMNTN